MIVFSSICFLCGYFLCLLWEVHISLKVELEKNTESKYMYIYCQA